MELDAARVAAGFGFLVLAAAMDVRERRVRDPVWVALGTLALLLVEVDLLHTGAPPALHLVPAATAVLFFGVFFGAEMFTEKGFRMRPLRLALYGATPVAILLAWTAATDEAATGTFYRLLTMPGMIVVAHGLYEFGLLRGGADAKALMALALLFPGIYPSVAGLPIVSAPPAAEPILAVLFPFAFVVLVNAVLLALIVPVLLLARNAMRRTLRFPRALVGYPVPIAAVPRHVWLMDRVEDGRTVFRIMPPRTDDREEQLRLLRARGVDRVWVTPQIPFLLAMLGGYALAISLGNVLLFALRAGT